MDISVSKHVLQNTVVSLRTIRCNMKDPSCFRTLCVYVLNIILTMMSDFLVKHHFLVVLCGEGTLCLLRSGNTVFNYFLYLFLTGINFNIKRVLITSACVRNVIVNKHVYIQALPAFGSVQSCGILYPHCLTFFL
jgi:hypothetical protein